jgi:hypothetical protein
MSRARRGVSVARMKPSMPLRVPRSRLSVAVARRGPCSRQWQTSADLACPAFARARSSRSRGDPATRPTMPRTIGAGEPAHPAAARVEGDGRLVGNHRLSCGGGGWRALRNLRCACGTSRGTQASTTSTAIPDLRKASSAKRRVESLSPGLASERFGTDASPLPRRSCRLGPPPARSM